MKFTEDQLGVLGMLAILAMWLGGVILSLALSIGYCLNIYGLVATCDFEKPYRAEAIRVIGILAPPVGGVAGWLTLEDGQDVTPSPVPEGIVRPRCPSE